MISLKVFLVGVVILGSRAAPVEDAAASPTTVTSVDLKKPTEAPRVEDSKLVNSNMAGPPQDMKPVNSAENPPASDANKGDVDKRFLLPGYGLGSGFGGYRGLHGVNGAHAAFANIGNFGNYADHLRGFGGYGVGVGLPVNVGVPGAYFG